MNKPLFEPPIVQVAIDYTNIDDALRVAEAAIKAGVNWLEAGTPLITFSGTAAVSALSSAFPGIPVLADYKCMDGARKYALETKQRGGRLCTVCAQAADETIRAMVAAGKEADVAIICDMINSPDVAARAAAVEGLGVDSLYVHWGSDQRAEQPDRDPQLDLQAVAERVQVPVGIGTFSVEEGARAIRNGAKIAVIGFPLIAEADVESELRRYVEAVHEEWARRT